MFSQAKMLESALPPLEGEAVNKIFFVSILESESFSVLNCQLRSRNAFFGLGVETASFFGKKDIVDDPTQFSWSLRREIWGSPKTVLSKSIEQEL